eukprot:237251_1
MVIGNDIWSITKKKTNPNPYPGWNGSDCILILCGKSDDAGYKRNNSIHIWLFGYELLSTIIIITGDSIYICAGSKTSATLQQLQQKKEEREREREQERIEKERQEDKMDRF